MTAGLEVEIAHRQGAFSLDLAFAAPGGVTALFGRSGSGKTTFVKIVSGLVRPQRARVVVDGAVLVDTRASLFVPPQRRRVGYVFQEARLFPHLTVRQNLLFGAFFARRLGPAPPDGPSLAEVVELLGIGHLLARRPATLSGGETQRVAIGRALLARPRILLLDEPLAALDEARRAEILPFVERLRDDARIPIVYVSHAVSEVARLADTIVVLEEGRLAASGPAADMLARLDVAALSGSRDAGAILDAVVDSHDSAFDLTLLTTPAGRLIVPRLRLAPSTGLRVQIRARDVMVAIGPPEGLSALNALEGTVVAIGEEAGHAVNLRLDCGGAPLLARLTRRSVAALGLRPGQRVFAIVKSVAIGESRGESAET